MLNDERGSNRLDNRKLVRRQYATQYNLATRVNVHQRYSESGIDFVAWILDHIPWRGDEIVLDVGCGAGSYAAPVQQRTPHYIAADLSMGMLRNPKLSPLPRVNLDAEQIPFAPKTVDVLLANHMIYHIPRREVAMRAFTRVLRPGGHLLAATNGENTMPELAALLARTAEELGLSSGVALKLQMPFTLENGASLLCRHFSHVTRHDLVDALLFPEPGPLLAYTASLRASYEAHLRPPHSWQDVEAVLHNYLEKHFARHTHFRVSKRTGVFVCRP